MAMIYSIDQIMSVRDRFREKPYPEFSLHAICRSRAPQTKLVRGEKAYVPARAVTADDATRKTIQSALNRLNDGNYDEILESLQSPMFIEADAVSTFVQLVFEKALQEPTYCHMYARLCYRMARYEVHTKAQLLEEQQAVLSPTEPSARMPRSLFRDTIVERAHHEFQQEDFIAPEGVTHPEELEDLLLRFVRRKKSNMRFVGHLFLEKVLSSRIMFRVIGELLHSSEDNFYPSELTIEVLIELLEHVGSRIESDEGQFMNEVFDRLTSFLHKDPQYPPRVHFKIMDCIERRNNNWSAREVGKAAPTPTAAKGGIVKARPTPGGTLITPTRKGGAMKFPDSPTPGGAAPPASAAGSSWKSVVVGKQGRVGSSTTPSSVGPSPSHAPPTPASPPPPLDKAVKTMYRGWTTDPGAIEDWVARFAPYSMAEEDLVEAIVAIVLTTVCTTTQKGAQQEAADFFLTGLQLEVSATLNGFTKALSGAVEEGIMEDSPKFLERLVAVLVHLHGAAEVASATPEQVTAAAMDAVRILFCTLAAIHASEEVDEPVECIAPLMSRLPKVAGDDATITGLVMQIRGSGALNGSLAAHILQRSIDRGVISGAAIRAVIGGPQAAAAKDVVDVLAELGVTA